MSQSGQSAEIRAALDYLDSFTNYEREPGYQYTGQAMNLDRVRKLLQAVNSPEKALSAIHIAGTKGKGSAAKMIHAILTAAGYRTGLYTSPHLVFKNERIQVNEEMISDSELAAAVQALRPGVDAVHSDPALGKITYFEMLTAAAFHHFAAKKTAYAVLETGLGGRFDATNVCSSLLTVITPISLDHTDLLGKTIPEIAQEKAMIIKPSAKVVVLPQPEDAMQVIEKRALETAAQIFPVSKFYQWQLNSIYPQEMSFDLKGKRNLPALRTKMVGPRQMMNAAAAVLVCDLLAQQGAKISDDTIRYGLARARMAGRFQTVDFMGRTIIFDGAHNTESAKALTETLALVYPGEKFSFIIGMSADKDAEGFLAEIKPAAKQIILTQSKHPRAAKPDQLKAAAADFPALIIEPALENALERISKLTRPGERLVITGSFFLVGEAIQWLMEKGIEIQIP